jgi:hypothetical protein
MPLTSKKSLDKQYCLIWRDPSPHTIRFVVVEKNVRLEVLDWGGSGRPLVFLAGVGTRRTFRGVCPETHNQQPCLRYYATWIWS